VQRPRAEEKGGDQAAFAGALPGVYPVALHDLAELQPFMMEKITLVKGIRSMSAGIAADIVKFNFDVAPIR